METKIELNENEVAAVSGGESAKIEFGPLPGTGSTNVGSPISLTGPYYASSYAEGTAYRAAIGWADLTAVLKYPDRAAGYEIFRYGEVIGWAPRSSFYFK